MPRVTMKTGFLAPDGSEEVLTEHICDWPDCPNVATQVLGCVREFGLSAVVCDQHATKPDAANAAVTKPRRIAPDR
jgi:hypothetical protein